MKTFAKNCLHGVFLTLALPLAAIAGFGHFAPTFCLGAQAVASVPGIVGDYLRIAYYKLTLTKCSLQSRVSFGSFFAHPEVALGRGVYIGAYCVLGRCSIGDRTQIASQVQILSGRNQHKRDSLGQIGSASEENFVVVNIGADCWIGASSVVMASIGKGTTIGAGTVVVRPVEAQVVAAGNPARVITQAAQSRGDA